VRDAAALARLLTRRGYRRISNAYRIVARVDKPDWKKPSMGGFVPDADFYRRCNSEDWIENVPAAVYRKSARQQCGPCRICGGSMKYIAVVVSQSGAFSKRRHGDWSSFVGKTEIGVVNRALTAVREWTHSGEHGPYKVLVGTLTSVALLPEQPQYSLVPLLEASVRRARLRCTCPPAWEAGDDYSGDDFCPVHGQCMCHVCGLTHEQCTCYCAECRELKLNCKCATEADHCLRCGGPILDRGYAVASGFCSSTCERATRREKESTGEHKTKWKKKEGTHSGKK